MNRYQDINAETVDRWVTNGWEWGVPVSHEGCERVRKGEWDVFLSPTRPVPHSWFFAEKRAEDVRDTEEELLPLKNCKILGLASGGGQQMPVFSLLGAECTVLDYSQKQLESERMVAERENYKIRIVRADMTKPLPFADGSFDLVFHPVSDCYVEHAAPILSECGRVLRPGGVLLAGYDNGINFIVDDTERKIVHSLPFHPLKDPALLEELKKGDDGIQFSHSPEEIFRGLLDAGFLLRDFYEDTNGTGFLHEHGIPTFYAFRAVKDGKKRAK